MGRLAIVGISGMPDHHRATRIRSAADIFVRRRLRGQLGAKKSLGPRGRSRLVAYRQNGNCPAAFGRAYACQTNQEGDRWVPKLIAKSLTPVFHQVCPFQEPPALSWYLLRALYLSPFFPPR